MTGRLIRLRCRGLVGAGVAALALIIAGAWPVGSVAAQEEVTSQLYRYREYEMATGFYEEYEVRPRRYQPFIPSSGVPRAEIGYSVSGAAVRKRTYLADSHWGIKFYAGRTCIECHPSNAKNNLHVFRLNLTCRQCHGGEPIASVQHYYSPLSPIRRHAYVCAKCHPQAGASFAEYLVHEPDPTLLTTARTFPVLFYAFWIMVALAVATFVVFLPHTALWGVRELFARRGRGGDSEDADED